MRPSLLYFLLGLSLLGTKLAYDHGQRQAGVWQERARVLDSALKVLPRTIKVTDTLYRDRVVRLTKRVQAWDTVTRVVEALPDTVRVPVETVRWIVAEADSTITACRSVVQTCEQRVAQRDSLNALLTRQNTLIREQVRRDVRKKWLERAAWAGLVVLVSR